MNQKNNKYQDIVILSIAPIIIFILILISFILTQFNIKLIYLNIIPAIIAVMIGGLPRFISGFKDICNFKITVNVFVLVAIIATLAIGEFRPAAIIVFIMAVSGAFESYVLDKTKKNIQELLNLAPNTALVFKDNVEIITSISEIKINDIIIVRPGNRIPVDGIVVFGESSVNQAPITGESLPVYKNTDDFVWSGTLNESGVLHIRTKKIGIETALAKIVHLVQEAQDAKAPIQNIADRFTTWFLPAVSILAIIAYFLSNDVKVAVSVLLVACPCAFAIATPTAVTAGISWLARRAVLVKGGVFLELGCKMDYLLLDKTGTITFGKTKLSEIIALNNYDKLDVLKIACIAEKNSLHPLARSIIDAAKENNLTIPDPEYFLNKTGLGVEAIWNTKKILVGNEALLKNSKILLTPNIDIIINTESNQCKTSVLVALENQIIGILIIYDEIRPNIISTIKQLKDIGIKHIDMLTGDNTIIASSIAKIINVDDFKSNLMPEQKQDVVRELKNKGFVVGMVGDGINDAPALALSDIGITMGITGSDVAIESADITLANDNLDRIVDFIFMSRKVFNRIKLNIFFSMIYNIIGLTLGVFGFMTPIAAILFQEAGCITVVLSSTLLLWIKNK